MSAPIITVLDENHRPVGPMTVEEVQHGLQRGEFRTDQLAHAPGFSQWTPLHAVLAHVTSAQPLPTYLQPPVTQPVPAAIAPRSPVQASAVAPQAAMPAPVTIFAPPRSIYAGFWRRLAAYIFDSLILSAITYIPIRFFFHIAETQDLLREMRRGFYDPMHHLTWHTTDVGLGIFVAVAVFGYFSLMESSIAQATFGKMLAGVKVTDLEGRRISFWHALGRTLAKWLPVAICCLFYVGWVMAAFTEKKQALHDFLAGTLVVVK